MRKIIGLTLIYLFILPISSFGAGQPSKSALKTEKTFKFIVIGDVQGQTEQTRKLVKEFNSLAPDFVVIVGDLIHGYENRAERVKKMWDDFDHSVEKLEVPLVTMPGNHDIWDDQSEKIYHRRYGKTTFSFDHKGAHFIILNSEVRGPDQKPIVDSQPVSITGEQLEWLTQDLAKNKDAKLKFIFLHKPLFQRRHWKEKIQPLLAEYKVNAVFSGHEHVYRKYPVIDGVHYYITGGGGWPIGEKWQGAFLHYSLVSVSGNDFKLAVIKPGAVAADDIITFEEIQKIPTVKISAIEVPRPGEQVPIEVRIVNYSESTTEATVMPKEDSAAHWNISPGPQTVTSKAKSTIKVHFSATLDSPQLAYPGPKFDVAVPHKDKGPLERTFPVPLKPFRIAQCPKTATAPAIDGKLDDNGWTGSTPLDPFYTPDTESKSKFPTEVRLARDNQNLYLSFRCREPNPAGLVTKYKERDWPMWQDDSVEIIIAPDRDRKTFYQFDFNANGAVYDAYNQKPDWNGEHTAKPGREKDAWTLEVAIRWKTLGFEKAPAPGTTMGLQIARFRNQEPKELTQWSPTYGGNQRTNQFGTLIIKD